MQTWQPLLPSPCKDFRSCAEQRSCWHSLTQKPTHTANWMNVQPQGFTYVVSFADSGHCVNMEESWTWAELGLPSTDGHRHSWTPGSGSPVSCQFRGIRGISSASWNLMLEVSFCLFPTLTACSDFIMHNIQRAFATKAVLKLKNLDIIAVCHTIIYELAGLPT